jgi:OFA family oxalate/formate antiporter-like MFS transporter
MSIAKSTSVGIAFLAAVGLSPSALAQTTALSWAQVREKFEATNPYGFEKSQPATLDAPKASISHLNPSFTPLQMLQTPIFWLMFAMMTMMSTAGLMVTSQIAAFTHDFGIANALVFGLPLLPLALSVDRITNGLTRPFFGWLSDQIGREQTMVIAFTLEGTAMTAWLFTRTNPAIFVVMSGVVLFGWGEIFSLFPSTLTDTYGTGHATTNYGFLYIAQGVGSVLGGPVAALVHDAFRSWMPVFAIIIAMNFATALLAGLALKPMRQRWLINRAAFFRML